MSSTKTVHVQKRNKFLKIGGIAAAIFLITLGIFASNGWLPSTDPMTGRKTGWFGKELPKNASSSWNPLAAPLPTPTPQLSKEYIYAGSRLLAVEDANATAAPPATAKPIWPFIAQAIKLSTSSAARPVPSHKSLETPATYRLRPITTATAELTSRPIVQATNIFITFPLRPVRQ